MVEIPSAIENSKAKDHAVPDNKNKEKVISIPSTLVFACKDFLHRQQLFEQHIPQLINQCTALVSNLKSLLTNSS